MLVQSMSGKILITGSPGIGKTTLIKKLADKLQSRRPVGFYTEEIRESGIRRGFRLSTYDGQESLLSHVDFRSRFKVGKYRVDVAGFEVFLDKIDFFGFQTKIVIIDEIGKMECFSERFRKIVDRLFGSDKRIIATIAARGGGFIETVKKKENTTIIEITYRNRDKLLFEIIDHLGLSD